MGGHGGLNILPQKRWNVYRRDNRAKVARDEAEHQRSQDEIEKHRRTLALDKKIGELRSRGLLNETDEKENVKLNNLNTLESDSTSLSILKLKEPVYQNDLHSQDCKYVSFEKKGRKRGRSLSPKTRMNSSDAHVNLFGEEEALLSQHKKKHQKYLTEVGHEITMESDFNKIIKETKNPWYMNKPVVLEPSLINVPQPVNPIIKSKRIIKGHHKDDMHTKRLKKSILSSRHNRSKHDVSLRSRHTHDNDIKRLRAERELREAQERLRVNRI